MKTELRMITPQVAREMLKHNKENRPLRIGWVDTLRAAWDRGEWKKTNASIGFATSGRLLDGQHRLTMISQLPEGTLVPVNVTIGMDDDSFDAIDQGKHRSLGDLYNITAGMAACATFCAKIANSSERSGLTPQAVRPFVEWIAPQYSALTTFCPSAAVVFSSAPVRTAAVLQMKRGHDEDFILNAYRSMVLSHIEEMPYAARALVQQRMNGKILSARSNDLFCRALRVFDSTQRQRISSILVKDMPAALAEPRDFIVRSLGKKMPATAGKSVAKPSANSTRKAAGARA